MPSKATARMMPKLNTVPPRSGPSIRYHTISIKKKAKPTSPAAKRTKLAGAAGAATGSLDAGLESGERSRDHAKAVSATATPSSVALQTQICMLAVKRKNETKGSYSQIR